MIERERKGEKERERERKREKVRERERKRERERERERGREFLMKKALLIKQGIVLVTLFSEDGRSLMKPRQKTNVMLSNLTIELCV
jgi:hypothetical protein